jgi:hypothetical protein
MPFRVNAGDRKTLMIAAAIFAVLVVAALLIGSPEGSEETSPTTYSVSSSGAKAAFLLLQETGYRIKRWEQSPAEIRMAPSHTLILAEPSWPADKEERAALQRFVREGGRLVAIGQSAGPMLPENACVATPFEELVWDKFPAIGPSSITRAAPQITLAPRARWGLPSSALVLYGKEKQAVVVRYPYGQGTVIWWASATPLTNAGLKEPGNLEFFLACLGDRTANSILWDEYFHGYGRSSKGSFEIKLLGGLLAQFAFLGAVILLSFSRRSGPVRPPAAEVSLSPLEFVETLGGLYEHARASAVAVDIHYQRFWYWLTMRLGMSPNTSIEAIEQAMLIRWNFCEKQFASVLRECASARYLPDLPPARALKLVRCLHSYAVQLKLFPASAKESTKWKPSRNY